MNTAHQYYNKDNPPQSTSIISLVKNILKDSDLSIHASNILAQLVLASGYEGYCWMLIDTISKNSRLGRTQTKLYLKELETKKRIRVHHRHGRSSRFEVLDITKESNEVSRSTDHIKEIKNKENVIIEKPNVILNFPDKDHHPILAEDNNTGPAIQEPVYQPTRSIGKSSNVIDMSLVQEIMQITNDKKSLGCFIKIVKNVPKNIIFAAISSLKIALSEGIIAKRGAYFVQTIKNYYPNLFYNPKMCPDSPITKNKPIVGSPTTFREQHFEPENVMPASPEVALEAINKIKLVLNKPRCKYVVPRS